MAAKKSSNVAVSNDPQGSEDLYTKIALDNKLITRFQVRKACEEQEELESDGKPFELGDVLVRMGFLSERQHQSVLNACRYREQRDYDKRFGRQVLRMKLLEQSDLEKQLNVQKQHYGKSGKVNSVADLLTEAGLLDAEQVEQVHRGIQERDRARRQAKGKVSTTLDVSGPTPVLKKETAADDLDDEDLDGMDLDDLEDVDLDDDDGSDLDDMDLDDDASDLDDVDLDDDLDASDLDDVDLDDDDDDDDGSDLDDVDLDDDDLDDEDLDDDDLSGLSEIEKIDLDGDDDDDIEAALEAVGFDDDDLNPDLDDLDDALDDIDGADGAGLGDSGLDVDDPINLDDLDLDDDDDDDDDENDLAQTVSELGSEVELDEEDLKALDEMDSGEQLEPADADWAADAFDDRPLNQRPPSERLKTASPSSTAGPPLPAVGPPPTRPEPPRSARAEQDTDLGAIPGGDVFEGNLSDAGAVESRSSLGKPASPNNAIEALNEVIEEAAKTSAAEAGDALTSSAEALITELDRAAHRDAPSEERRSLIESAVTDAFSRASSRLRSQRSEKPTQRLDGEVDEPAAEEPEVAAAPKPAPQAAAESKHVATPPAAPPPPSPGPPKQAAWDTSDPRLQKAFERAMQAAWEAFKAELDGA